MKTSKNKRNCYCFGGEISPPPKGPEKNTVELVMHTLEIRNSLPFVTNWNREQFAYGEFLPMFQLMMTQAFIYSVSVKRFQCQLVAENLSLIPRLTDPLIVSFQLDTHTLPSPQHKDSSNHRLTHSHEADLLHLLSPSSHFLQPFQWPHTQQESTVTQNNSNNL